MVQILKSCVKQGTFQKVELIAKLRECMQFPITKDHESFVSAFEKKVPIAS